MKMTHGMKVVTNRPIPFWRDSHQPLINAPVVELPVKNWNWTAIKRERGIPKGATGTIIEMACYVLWHDRKVPASVLRRVRKEDRERIIEAWLETNGKGYHTSHHSSIDDQVPLGAVVTHHMFAIEFDNYPETDEKYFCGIGYDDLPDYLDWIESNE